MTVTKRAISNITVAMCLAVLMILAGCGEKEPRSVKITPESKSLQEGESVRFEAAAFDEDGERLVDATISWSVEGDAGTIDSAGTFTAVQEGEAKVVASTEDIFGHATVTVTPLPPKLARIKIDPQEASVEVGDSLKLEAVGVSDKNQEMPDVDIAWSMEGESGSISEEGFFEAVKPGKAKVEAKSGEFSATGMITVIPPPIKGINVNADREKALPGSVITMTVTATSDDKKPAAYATVNVGSTREDLVLSTNTLSLDESGTGVLEAHLPAEPAEVELVFEGGEAMLKLGFEATPIVRIEIEPDAGPYEAGQTVNFEAVGYDAYGNSTPVEVEWSITGESAGIDQNGKAIMSKPGEGLVLAAYKNMSAGLPFSIEAGAPADVKVTPAEVSLQAGNAVSFGAECYNRYGFPLLSEVTWSVEGDMGSISEDGFFQAWKTGEGRIVAKGGDASGTADVKVEHGPLASVVIDIPEATITAGEMIDLKAYGVDAHDNRFEITPEWFLSKSLGVLDKEAGTFTARFAGEGEIRALADGGGAAATIKVVPAELVHLEISPARVDLLAGESVAFEVRGYDKFDNRVEIDPQFSLADDLGPLEEDGAFEARKAGTATVTAAAGDLEARATVTVEPFDMVRVTIDPSGELTLSAGDTRQLTARGWDEFGNVVASETHWTVVPDLGKMGVQGNFLAKKAGKGSIKAALTQKRTGIQMSDSIVLTVDPGPTARIEIVPDSLEIKAGEECDFSATAYDEFGNPTGSPIQWSIAGTTGSIDEKGVFRARQAKKTKIRAGVDGVFSLAEVEVVPSEVVYLKIVPSDLSLEAGSSTSLHVMGEDKFGNTVDTEVAWNLTDPELGRISGDGTLTAMKAGEAMVLATSRNLVDKATLVVKKSGLASIQVLPSSVRLNAGDKIQFQARGMDAGGNELDVSPEWSVEGDAGVIDQEGNFEGRTRGSGKILASVGDLSGEAHVEVTPGTPAEIIVEPSSLDLSASESQKLSVQVKDEFGNLIEDASYAWVLSSDLGTMEEGDIFYAHTVGEGELKITCGDASTRLPVIVHPGPLSRILVLPESLETQAGAETTLKAEGFDMHGNEVSIEPVWCVTDGLGVFSEPGVFEARHSGKGYICAAVDAVVGTAGLVVKPGPVTNIDVQPANIEVEAGSELDFTATAYDALGNEVPVEYEWTVGNTQTAAISPQGTFLSRSAHRAEIFAASGDVKGRAEVEVVPAEPIEIQVAPSEVFMKAGERKKLSAFGLDRFGNKMPVDVVMSVDPERLGRFIDSTVFEAGGAGEGFINVKSGDLRCSVPLKVSTGALVRIEIRLPEGDIRAAETHDLVAVGFDAGGNEIPVASRWAVSDEIGSIEGDSGRFYARKTGKGVVTARSGEVAAFRWIEVKAGKLYSVFVSPNPETLKSGEITEFSIDGVDIEENPVDINRDAAQWEVVGRIGYFQTPGVFTATKMGKGKVTAAVGDLIGQSYVTVEPGAPDPENSRVRLTYPVLAADGASTSDILIVIRDKHNNPVPGVAVTMISDRQVDTIVQPDPTNKEGVSRGSIYSGEPGTSTVTALVGGATIPVKAQVRFE
ncbi:MAG: Ig-like domain-containing protein [Desulfatiglandaceae bacterium]